MSDMSGEKSNVRKGDKLLIQEPLPAKRSKLDSDICRDDTRECRDGSNISHEKTHSGISGNRKRFIGKGDDCEIEDDDDDILKRPTLLTQLRSILEQYDEGQILKELIQNADDAGAKHIKFLFDKSSHPADHLYRPEMAQFQGCALYTYNDSKFTKEDWLGIGRLQDSIKKDDPSKVGRFGLGFKSVFHLTDLPSIASGDTIMFIDPQEKFFNDPGRIRSGKKWNLCRKSDWHDYEDQFRPFAGIFKNSLLNGSPYDGTVFRFPLRQIPSQLSKSLCDQHKIDILFQNLKNDAHLFFLFLKHIESIEISERQSPVEPTRVIYRASIVENCLEEVRNARNGICDGLKAGHSSSELSYTYPVTIEIASFSSKETKMETRQVSFLVNELMGDTKGLTKEDQISANDIPLVGTAIAINSSEEASNNTTPGIDPVIGKVFCFLPLPLEQTHPTGLPVHVNGYFEISQNRRHLEWPAISEQENRHIWNQILLNEFLSKSYFNLLTEAVNLNKRNPTWCEPNDIYNALPNSTTVDEKWKSLLKVLEFYFDRGEFYTKAGHGKWERLSACYLNKPNIPQVVSQFLIEADINVIDVPNHIMDALESIKTKVETVTAGVVKEIVRGSQTLIETRDFAERCVLLDYVLSDDDSDDVYGFHKLLPLADGSFTQITKQGETIFMQSDEYPLFLLPGMEHRFVQSLHTQHSLQEKLVKLAKEGSSNLQILDQRSFCEMVVQILPREMENENSYYWDHQTPKHSRFPKTWWYDIWTVIAPLFEKYQQMCREVFQSWPILPLTNKESTLLVSVYYYPKPILDQNPTGDTIDKALLFLLKNNDIPFVKYEKVFACIQRSRFFVSPTPFNVLDNLTKHGLNQKLVTKLKQSKDVSLHGRIFSLLFKLNNLSVQNTNFLSKLPLFKSTRAPTTKTEWISVEKAKGIACDSNLCYIRKFIEDDYILPEQACDSQLLSNLFEMNIYNVWNILVDSVIPSVRTNGVSGEIKLMFEQIFTQLTKQLRKLDSSVLSQFSDIAFVSTKGECMEPQMLYNVTDVTLNMLFCNVQDKFPDGVYAKKGSIEVLLKMGLKIIDDVTPSDVLQQAQYVDAKCISEDAAVKSEVDKISDAIVTVLHNNVNLFEQIPEGYPSPLAQLLRDLKWLPVIQERPPQYPRKLAWAGKCRLVKPSSVKPKQWTHVIGSIAPLTEFNDLCNFLSVPPPSLKQAVLHFKNIQQSYTSSEKVNFLCCLTQWYQSFLECDIVELQNLDIKQVADTLNTKMIECGITKWAWQGEGFCSPKQLVLESLPRDLSPYLYSVPPEMKTFVDIFVNCGAQQQLSKDAYTGILEEVSLKHSSGRSYKQSTVEKDLRLVLDILHDLGPNASGDVLFPVDTNDENATLKLLPASDCTYSDRDWLQDYGEEESNIYCVHPDVPSRLIELYNIPSLMNRLLDAEELPASFGQSESLVNRIRGLLDQYADGMSIPKEMLQNADDAGATKLQFLVDMRENDDAKRYLLDENMKHVHGPALWVHNDAKFTPEDVENITKLGGRTKANKTEAVGKFGLGFNVVYNITDVPSFVSDNTLVIFDPLTTFLGKCIRDKTKPGIKIDLKKNKVFLRKMRDQFKPFQGIFGCNINSKNHTSYDGTLFRLPLRTFATLSVSNELCGEHAKPYTITELKDLFSMLHANANELLLFTQNVKEISVYFVPESSTDVNPKEVFIVSKSIDKLVRNPSFINKGNVSKVLAIAKSADMKQENIHSGSTEFNENSFETTALIKTKVLTSDNNTLLSNTSKELKIQYWLVNHSYKRYSSTQLPVGTDQNFVIGGCAIEILKRGQRFDIEVQTTHENGKAFSFLPLPLKTGLAFHINGCFEVDSSRKTIVTKDMDDKTTPHAHNWNKLLLEDAITESVICVLFDLKDIISPNNLIEYSKLWPQIIQTVPAIKPLAYSFYQAITDRPTLPILHQPNEVITMENIRFLDEHFTKSRDAISAAKQVLAKTQPELYFLAIDKSFSENFIMAKCETFLQKKTLTVYDFFRSSFFPYIKEVAAHERDVLLIFAIKEHFDTVKELLRTSPCIPVFPSGKQCKVPAELVSPHGRWALLFDKDDCRFPDKHFVKTDILGKLAELGMVVDDCSWSLLIERANTLQDLYRIDITRGHSRFEAIIVCLERHIQTSGLTESIEQFGDIFKTTSFIPLLEKPGRIPFPWKSDGCDQRTLVTPREVCRKAHLYLVCSERFVMVDVHMSKELQSFLGLDKKNIPLSSVLCHLKRISEQKVDTTNITKFEQAVQHIYEFLDVKINNKQDLSIIKESLADSKWIYQNLQFLTADKLAFDDHNKCEPYHYCVSASLLRHDRLLRELGVKQKFTISEYIHTLDEIREKHGDEPLDKSHMNVVFNVLKNLEETVKIEKPTNASNIKNQMFIPNASKVMCKANKLYFNDLTWALVSTAKLTHDTLSPSFCKCFGIPSWRDTCLRLYSFGIPCGQKEQLCTSLKRILLNYPFGHEIFFEMLQNADDAGAKEIHFILDKNTHSGEKLLFDSYKKLQGPALCVYNDSPFTQDDLKGIQNLGEGSKGNDPAKTGKYGIGFSSVYHLTDVPCILTHVKECGRNLIMLDPNRKYVPGSTLSEPGIRFENIDELQTNFPDMFSCFPPHILNNTKGTTFRFPLRTGQMANISQINKEERTVKDMETLFTDFSEDLKDVLIFTKYVNHISLSVIERGETKVKLRHSIKRTFTEHDQQVHTDFNDKIMRSSKQYGKGYSLQSDIQHRHILYKMCIEDEKHKTRELIAVKQFGFKNTENIPKSVEHATISGNLGYLPIGGVACFTIPNGMKSSRLFSLVPIPTQNYFPVHIHGSFVLGFENRRQLWDQQSKPHNKEWNLFLFEKVILPCYIHLLCQMKYSLENCSPTEYVFRRERYFKLFPNILDKTSEWFRYSKSFYQQVHATQSSLFPWPKPQGQLVNIQWCCAYGNQQATGYFASDDEIKDLEYVTLDADWRSIEHKEIYHPTSKVLTACGYKIIKVLKFIIQGFDKASVTINILSPESIIEFFASYNKLGSLCTIGIHYTPKQINQTPFVNSEMLYRIVRYCKKGRNFRQKVSELPFLLTADGILRQFSPVFKTKYSGLLEKSKHLFLHESFVGLFDDLLKDFSINEFALAIGNETYSARIFKSKSPIEWIKQTGLPSKTKIKQIWEFLESHNSSHTKYQLSFLQEWALLPIERGQKKYLIPFDLAYLTLDPSSPIYTIPPFKTRRKWTERQQKQHEIELKRNETERNALRILEKLPFYNIDMAIRMHSCARLYSTNVSEPINVLKAVYYLVKEHKDFPELIYNDRYGCTVLMEYFSLSIEYNRICQDLTMRSMLKEIPIFENKTGAFTNIPDGYNVYTLPIDIPADEVEAWRDPERLRLIFLAYHENLRPLYKFINCEELDYYEVYDKFIFAFFNNFTFHTQCKHLYFLYRKFFSQNISSKPNAESILNALKSLAFLHDEDGNLRTVGSFYDPQIEIFKAMESPSDFPPRCNTMQFSFKEWHEFLKLLGLRCVVTCDIIKEYANTIERENIKSRYHKAKALVKHVFREMIKEDMLNVLGHISESKIIEVTPLYFLMKIYQQKGVGLNGETSTMCYKGSLVRKYANLAWTREYILPSWADPDKYIHDQSLLKEVQMKLGIQVSANVHVIIDNFLTICERFLEEETPDICVNKKKDLFRNYYSYLQEVTLPQEEISRLKKAKCILVENALCQVTPGNMVFHLDNDEIFRPYLYKVPRQYYANFTRIIETIGVSERPTSTHFMMTLNALKKHVGHLTLNVNEKLLALKAEAELFSCLDNDEALEQEESLHLLSLNDHLINTTKLVFNDAPNIRERVGTCELEFMVYLRQIGVRSNKSEEALIRTLPLHLQPALLSEIISEILTDRSECDLKFLPSWNQRLQSDEFRQGVSRLIRHRAHRTNEYINDEDVEKLLEKLSLVQVFEADFLETKLIHRGSEVACSVMEKSYFVQQQSTEHIAFKYKIFIDSSLVNSVSSDIIIQLADAVNVVLEKRLSESVLFLFSILDCPLGQISSKLDHFNVSVDTAHRSQRVNLVPELGTPLSDNDMKHINYEMGDFMKGEFVAYRSRGESTELVYAKVIGQVKDSDICNNVEILMKNDRPSILVNPLLLSKIHRLK